MTSITINPVIIIYSNVVLISITSTSLIVNELIAVSIRIAIRVERKKKVYKNLS